MSRRKDSPLIPVTIRLHPAAYRVLERLLETGLWGHDIDQAARLIVLERLREELLRKEHRLI